MNTIIPNVLSRRRFSSGGGAVRSVRSRSGMARPAPVPGRRPLSGRPASQGTGRCIVGCYIIIVLLCAMLCTVSRSYAGNASCGMRSWAVPTILDNISNRIERLIVSGQAVLFVPAAGNVHLIAYDGQDWSNVAQLAPPNGYIYNIYGVADTDRVVSWPQSAPAMLDFHRVSSNGQWGWELLASAVLPVGTQWVSLKAAAPTTNSAVVLTNGGLYLVAAGQPPAGLGVAASRVLWTPGGIFAVREVSAGQNTELTATLYHSTNGGVLAEQQYIVGTDGYWFAEPGGLWFGEDGVLQHSALPTFAVDRTLNVAPDVPTDLLALPDSGVLLLTLSPNTVNRQIFRFDAADVLVFRRETSFPSLVELSPDGAFAAGGNTRRGELLDVQTGVAMTYRLFADTAPSRGNRFVRSPDGDLFYAKANYWWDGVYIYEIDRLRGPWEQPRISPRWSTDVAVVDFGVVSVGQELALPVVFRNEFPNSREVYLTINGSSPITGPPFDVSTRYILLPGEGSSQQVDATFRPTSAGVHLAFLRAEEFGSTSHDYNVLVLIGRTESQPSLTDQQRLFLESVSGAAIQYHFDAETVNLLCEFPCSWHANESGRALGGYCVPHEIGLHLLALASEARRGAIPAGPTWNKIETGLHSLRIIQMRLDQFSRGVFHRSYQHRSFPDGADLPPEQVVHDAQHPSSDDNALLAMDLLLVERMARDAGRSEASRLCRLILGELDLRRFLTLDGRYIAHWRSMSGQYSNEKWDRRGAEGAVIAAAMACLGQLTREEFATIIDAMSNPLGHWHGRFFVPQGDYHGMCFVRGVRAQAGCPVTGSEFSGCNYAASLFPLFLAHQDDASEQDIHVKPVSHDMTQTVNGQPQTDRGAGNEHGILCDTERQLRSAPHAFFVPLARYHYLPQSVREDLFSQMAAYAPLYFHDEPGLRGPEAAIPLRWDAPYTGTDAGHATELLGTDYTILSIHDALAIDGGGLLLSDLHPAGALVGYAMAYVDSGTSLPGDFPAAYLPDLCAAPVIAADPQGDIVCEGARVTFTVTAEGTDLAYQWRKNGVAIPGAEDTSYTIDPVGPADAGSYDVVVTNGCGSAASAAAVLTILAEGGACDDGNVCAVGETCQGGDCTGGTPLDCSTVGDQCNQASCDPSGAEGNCVLLTPTNQGGACDDAKACTVGEFCQSGSCTGGTAPDCSGSGDQCNQASCDTSGAEGNCDLLTPDNEGGACDDGDTCTESDVCTAGTCAGTPKDCSVLDDDCYLGVCDPATGNCQAEPRPNGTPCDDGDDCTENDICTAGTCAGTPTDCSALDDECNVGACDPVTGNCQAEAVADDTACPDGAYCNGDETCVGGTCTGTPDPCVDLAHCDEVNDICICLDDGECDDAVDCTNDACVAGVCHHSLDNLNCPDDGEFCTGTESCDAQLGCVPSGNPCPTGQTCNESTDTCDPAGGGEGEGEPEDEDGDGVPDDTDACPGTETGAEADANGCSCAQRDGDADGVNDCDDLCTHTPTGQTQTVNSAGCSCSELDADEDGVNNCVDDCPNTSPQQTVDDAGCANAQRDDDGDGAANGTDQCPDTPGNQIADANGCSCLQLDPDGDDDSDGVLNCMDECSDTADGQTADADGCPCLQLDPDGDDDGDDVLNCLDECPDTPNDQTANADGCSCLQLDPDGDDDGDDVLNCLDECPDTPNDQTANADGCSCLQLDPDGDDDVDGVLNCLDGCPNTPAGQAVNSSGCPLPQVIAETDGPEPEESLPDSGDGGEVGGTEQPQDDPVNGRPPSRRVAPCGVFGVFSFSFTLAGLLVMLSTRRHRSHEAID